jgi:hypothetical protein
MRRFLFCLSAVAIGCVLGPMAASQRTAGLLLAQNGPTGNPDAPGLRPNGRFGDPDVYARNFQDYLYGVITKVHQDKLVLDKTKFGVPETIKLNRKTKFVRSGKRGSLAQLKPGEMVFVQVKKDKKTGSLTAKKVVSGLGPTNGG